MDDHGYVRFMGLASINQNLNTFLGIIEGIAIDRTLNPREIDFIKTYMSENEYLFSKHPLNEIGAFCKHSISSGIVTNEMHDDIISLCRRLKSTDYYSAFTGQIQILNGILGGIVADNEISANELMGLRNWLDENSILRGTWPFEDISSLITATLRDGKISEEESIELRRYFAQFIAFLDDRTIAPSHIDYPLTRTGICAADPIVEFEGRTFCGTGRMQKYVRSEFQEIVESLGGTFQNNVTKDLDYLIVGSEGNECWAFAAYGRKIEKTMEYRRAGSKIWIVHELDFHDAVADAS
jgi:NAD-dependent DNA ligase